MKRLVVCADGTWNSRDQARADGEGLTNVARLADAIAPADAAGVVQEARYFHGVGVDGPSWAHLLGGATGWGLSENVKACYRWLVDRFAPGDQLFFFGFSRGAYTARSLAGLVRNCGVLRREHVQRIDEAYDLYRDRGSDTHPKAPRAMAFRNAYAEETRIHVVGVWDTVGSLGVPTSGPLGWWTRQRYGFHDVALSSWVTNAFHALAIDERRKPFAPTLWEVDDVAGARAAGQRVEQVWFAGDHCDVGGGHAECGLSDVALGWMIARARECGLAFVPGAATRLRADAHGRLHDSMTRFYRTLGEFERPIRAERRGGDGRVLETFESVSDAALDRQARTDPRYDPPNLRRYLERLGAVTPAYAPPAAASVPVPPPG